MWQGMSPAAAEARVAEEDRRQMMLARRGRSVGEGQGEGAAAQWKPGQAVMRKPTPEEMEAARRRNEQRLMEACNETVQRDKERLQRAPNLVSALGEDVLTYSLGPLGALLYNLAKEEIRGGPPSSPDLVADIIDYSGGQVPEPVEAFVRSVVNAFILGTSTFSTLRHAAEYFGHAEPRRGPSVVDEYQAHRREMEARAREEADRHPSGEQQRTEAARQPISFEEIEEQGAMEAAWQWRQQGYTLAAIENRLTHHTGRRKPSEERMAEIMFSLESGRRTYGRMPQRERWALPAGHQSWGKDFRLIRDKRVRQAARNARARGMSDGWIAHMLWLSDAWYPKFGDGLGLRQTPGWAM